MPGAKLKITGSHDKAQKRITTGMKEVDDSLHEAAVKYRAPDQLITKDEDQKGPGRVFPAPLTAYDPDDDRLEAKVNAPAELGYKMLQNEDIQNLQRKAQNAQYAEFIVRFKKKYPFVSRKLKK